MEQETCGLMIPLDQISTILGREEFSAVQMTHFLDTVVGEQLEVQLLAASF